LYFVFNFLNHHYIIHHKLVYDRPVSALSNSLFIGFPSRHHPFGLKFSIIFGILLLFVLVACHSQLDLYLLNFSSTGSTLNSSKFLKNFISIDVRHFLYFFLRVQILLPYKRIGRTSILGTFLLENFWTPSSSACGAT
jgi:hypothetical protein